MGKRRRRSASGESTENGEQSTSREGNGWPTMKLKKRRLSSGKDDPELIQREFVEDYDENGGYPETNQEKRKRKNRGGKGISHGIQRKDEEKENRERDEKQEKRCNSTDVEETDEKTKKKKKKKRKDKIRKTEKENVDEKETEDPSERKKKKKKKTRKNSEEVHPIKEESDNVDERKKKKKDRKEETEEVAVEEEGLDEEHEKKKKHKRKRKDEEKKNGNIVKNGIYEMETSHIGKKKKRRKSCGDEEREGHVEEVPKEKHKERRSSRNADSAEVRLTNDLLIIVASHLMTSPAILVFRDIDSVCDWAADRALKRFRGTEESKELVLAGNVLSENPFEREGYIEWCEGRPSIHVQLGEYLKDRGARHLPIEYLDSSSLSPPVVDSDAISFDTWVNHKLRSFDPSRFYSNPPYNSDGSGGPTLFEHVFHSPEEEISLDIGDMKGDRGWHSVLDMFIEERKNIRELKWFDVAEPRQIIREEFLRVKVLRFCVDELSAFNVIHFVRRLVVFRELTSLEAYFPICAKKGKHRQTENKLASLFTNHFYAAEQAIWELFSPQPANWPPPNSIRGEADPMVHVFPNLQHLALNITNNQMFSLLSDESSYLRHLRSIRIGRLTDSRLFVCPIECLIEDDDVIFGLASSSEVPLERVSLRVGHPQRVSQYVSHGVRRLFEALPQLSCNTRVVDISVCSSASLHPFRSLRRRFHPPSSWSHINIHTVNLHFEEDFDVRGLEHMLPPTMECLSISLDLQTKKAFRRVSSLLSFIKALRDFDWLKELRIQVWGVRCLESLLHSISECHPDLAVLSVSAMSVSTDRKQLSDLLTHVVSKFHCLRELHLHACVLRHLVDCGESRGFEWRNALGRLSARIGLAMDSELTAARQLPPLYDNEQINIDPHWKFKEDDCPPSDEDSVEESEEEEDGDEEQSEHSTDDDSIINDDEIEDEETEDELGRMEEMLEEETERREKRDNRRRILSSSEGEDVEEEEEEWDSDEEDSEEEREIDQILGPRRTSWRNTQPRRRVRSRIDSSEEEGEPRRRNDVREPDGFVLDEVEEGEESVTDEEAEDEEEDDDDGPSDYQSPPPRQKKQRVNKNAFLDTDSD